MEKIEITDLFERQVAIGKKLFEQHHEIYNDLMIASITNVINDVVSKRPDLANMNKDDIFYHSIYDYWVYGNNISEEFYFGFLRKTHLEKQKYITFRQRYEYILHNSDNSASKILKNKYDVYCLFRDYFKRDVIKISSRDDFSQFQAFISKHPVFVVKPSDLALGIGVHLETANAENSASVFEKILEEGLSNQRNYKWGGNSSVVLEEVIDQDDRLNIIHPASINAVRLTTWNVNGKINIVHPWLKFGFGGQFMASAAQGGGDAGIDPVTGVILTEGCQESGVKLDVHPAHNIRFKGFQIPNWSDAVEMCSKLALMIPNIKYIGWDIALSKKGWCIMEANWAGEFMWQMIYDYGCRDEIETMLNWASSKEFWWQK